MGRVDTYWANALDSMTASASSDISSMCLTLKWSSHGLASSMYLFAETRDQQRTNNDKKAGEGRVERPTSGRHDRQTKRH